MHLEVQKVYKIGWFSSGRDEVANELLNVVYYAIHNGYIDAEIHYVFCNRERGQSPDSDAFLDLVASYGIPLITFSSKNFRPELRKENIEEWRLAYDKEVLKKLKDYNNDLCVLAGYMLITGKELCNECDMINLHPAAPGGPKGTWQEVIWELLEKNANSTGVMMHLVTEELDRGPAISYCSFPIRGGKFDPLWEDFERKQKSMSLDEIIKSEGESEPLFSEVRLEGVRREIPLIIQTIKEFAERKIRIIDRSIVAEGVVVLGGYDLTKEIEELIGEG
jgi:phosphoribosylglycinamide formyltransferase-1